MTKLESPALAEILAWKEANPEAAGRWLQDNPDGFMLAMHLAVLGDEKEALLCQADYLRRDPKEKVQYRAQFAQRLLKLLARLEKK